MMRFVLITTLTLGATPLLAQSENEGVRDFDAARSAVEAIALALDVDSDGFINRPELMAAAALAFPLYDSDSSGYIDPAEFKSAEFGFSDMARVRDRQQAYDAAFGLVFDLFDRDEDGQLNNEDFMAAINRAFSFADIDVDNALTHDEFMRGYIMNVALRHAMSD